jgi:transcriptional regulator with XRE-family HTH domain
VASRRPVGELLRVARERRRLTLREVSETSGYSISLISRIERGERDIHTIELAQALAVALGLSPLKVVDRVLRDRRDTP